MSEENIVIKERLGDPGFMCNRIDYSRDAIIEASAGTGKTYTLQSIVLKLLTEKKVESVKNLLLVTYTEKAAGELKDRIRDILEKAGCLPPDFDEVTICTIHSFCRELLAEYAFENRVPMETEICASDKTMIHQAVMEALHSEEYRRAQGAQFVELMTEAGLTADELADEVEKRFKATAPIPETSAKGRGKVKEQVRDCKAILINVLRPIAQRLFQESKEAASAMTFDDLVCRAREVVVKEARLDAPERPSALLSLIRRRYRIALVDEFQDTDKAQWDIFRCIFSHHVNRIGDGPEPKQGALLVVGDPKQAIYSFRGADIATYLEAKHAITGGDDEKTFTLDTTYRSSPALVDSFNRIFGKKVKDDHSWFEDMKEGDGTIGYRDVKPPEKSDRFNGIVYHPDFGGPVELLESLPREQKAPGSSNSGYGNKTICLPQFLRNAAREIKRLVALRPAYTTLAADSKEPEEHRLSYRDMCILVRGHADADKTREILAEAKIPFSIYKEQGIYDSAEAESLLALFDFLAAPSRRGRLEALLMTPLFGYSPSQLEARLKEEDSDFARLLAVWEDLAARKRWCLLFEHIMDDTLLAHPGKDDSDFDRRWSATRQILDRLLSEAGRKAQTIDEFAEILRSWRQDDKSAGENGALRRKESEADCVKIMTMHVSKGLEFPVVFVAWGFGKLGAQAEAGEKEKAIREGKRLLYVALTRAEHKLYLPWSQWAQHKRMRTVKDRKTKEETTVAENETGIGSVSSALLIPNDPTKHHIGFLARGIRACFDGDDAAKEAVLRVSERLWKSESSLEGDFMQETAGDGVAAPSAITVYDIDAKALARQKIDNDSYSSIHRKVKETTVPDGNSGKDDEDHGGISTQRKVPTLLPRNNISGDVFHEIMEALCNNDDGSDAAALGFCTVGNADFAQLAKDERFLNLIRSTMRRHQLASQTNGQSDDSTELVLARMVWHALNVPIDIGGRTIVLKEIDASNRRAELEFVVNRAKVLGDDGVTDGGDPKVESTFNGKIDLLVRPDGLGGPVYILDWKTNSLPDYGIDAMERAMTESDYHLQYQFYSQAVRYWLGGAELGGVAYMFVRAGERPDGLDGTKGVFVAKAEAISAEACRAAIRSAMDREGDGYDN